ncbi:MAG: 4-vinyl reductase [Bacteroidales bacterium]|nr:4-vinyl reductase [Bacteroidales bacterium]
MITTTDYIFKWKDLGDIDEGRPNLGSLTYVTTYRMMQYSLRSVMNNSLGADVASQLFFDAGKLAGSEFCLNVLNRNLDFYSFISHLQSCLQELKMGILRVEKTDLEKMNFTIVVAEDLDCSGLPITEETVCDFDEGFLSGIFQVYSSKEFDVTETDCWSKGDRVCRFEVSLRQ